MSEILTHACHLMKDLFHWCADGGRFGIEIKISKNPTSQIQGCLSDRTIGSKLTSCVVRDGIVNADVWRVSVEILLHQTKLPSKVCD